MLESAKHQGGRRCMCGSGSMRPQEDFVILDAVRSLLRPFPCICVLGSTPCRLAFCAPMLHAKIKTQCIAENFCDTKNMGNFAARSQGP